MPITGNRKVHPLNIYPQRDRACNRKNIKVETALQIIFRILFITMFFLFAGMIYGMMIILIVRDNGFRFEPVELLYSIPIGLSFIFTVFYIIKCICCPNDDIGLIHAFYR